MAYECQKPGKGWRQVLGNRPEKVQGILKPHSSLQHSETRMKDSESHLLCSFLWRRGPSTEDLYLPTGPLHHCLDHRQTSHQFLNFFSSLPSPLPPFLPSSPCLSFILSISFFFNQVHPSLYLLAVSSSYAAPLFLPTVEVGPHQKQKVWFSSEQYWHCVL